MNGEGKKNTGGKKEFTWEREERWTGWDITWIKREERNELNL